MSTKLQSIEPITRAPTAGELLIPDYVLERSILRRAQDLTVRSFSPRTRRRAGLTLLELIIASSMLAVVMTSLSLVMRTARNAWDSSDSEYGAMHHATTVARHFVREAREARHVTQLSAGGKSVRLEMANGQQVEWSLDGTTHGMDDVVVLRNLTSGEEVPLARDIRDLSFTGLKADASTLANKPEDIQLLQVQVTVDRPAGGQQIVSAQVWIRSW